MVLRYRVVHRPHVAARARPSISSEILFALKAGAIVRVECLCDNGWAELTHGEVLERISELDGADLFRSTPGSVWTERDREARKRSSRAFVLLDGASIGLGLLLEP